MPGNPETDEEAFFRRRREDERQDFRDKVLFWAPFSVALACAFFMTWEMAEIRGRVHGMKACLDQLQPQIQKLKHVAPTTP